MKNYWYILFATFVMVACSKPPALGPSISVQNAWTRPAHVGGSLAIYLTISNQGTAADTLASAECPEAETAELHITSMDDEIASMHSMHGLDIQPGKTVIFEPGSMHIMLVGIKLDLRKGDQIGVILIFQETGRIRVLVEVKE